MRLYKGTRIDDGKWVYGYYFKTPLTAENCGCDSFLSGEQKHCISDSDGAVFEVNYDSIGQQTGKQDENKKDI